MLAKIIVDILIIAIVGIVTFVGVKRGFFLTVTKPVKWFAAIVLAFALCTPFATNVLEPLIEAPITNQITDYLVKECADITAENAGDKMPTILKIAAALADINTDGFSGDNSEAVIGQLVDKLAVPVVHLISVILSFIIIYILSKILLKIALKIINSVLDRGFFGVLNKILGGIFGFLFGFVLAWLFVVLFAYAINIPFIADFEWAQSFDGGYIYEFFETMSPIELLLSF